MSVIEDCLELVVSGRADIALRDALADIQMMLLAIATTARTFLLPHWARWHRLWGPPSPAIASQWTCVRSSIFLVKALHRCGLEATLQSGQAPNKAPGIAGEECGLFTADGWMGHAWVEAEGFVVDITADQFGYAPVIVTPAAHATYRPARDEVYTLRATKSGMAAIDEIWPSWCSYVDHNNVC